MLLKNKNIFVTGGSRGLGRAAVLELVKEGANVAFTYLNSKGDAELTKAESLKINPASNICYYQLDVKDSEKVDQIAEKAIADLGSIQVVVNNAGIVNDGPMYYMTDDQWHEVLETDLTGTFYVCRAFLEEFIINKGGKFINVSSISHQGSAGQANYAAAKAGIIGLSKTIAKEYGNKNIYCNVIIPGYFGTDMTNKNSSEVLKDYAARFSNLQREGSPSEFGKVVLFLASELSSFVNGETINVTGGLDYLPPVNPLKDRKNK